MIIVKVPGVNGLGNTKGTRNAGRKILEGIEQSGKYRHEEIHVDNDDLVEQDELIYRNSLDLFEEEDRIIFLGGDHSISYSIGSAFFEKHPEGKLIVFDAHADCMDPMKEPTHEEWLRALIERRDLFGEDVLIIGMRKIEPEEKKFLEEKNVQMISVEDIRFDSARTLRKLRSFLDIGHDEKGAHPARHLSRSLELPPTRPKIRSPNSSSTPENINDKEKLLSGKSGQSARLFSNNKPAVYVSFDIDVFDKEIAKATHYLEEAGLDEDEVLRLLGVILEAGGRIKGFDLVEVNLDFDKEEVEETARLAREIVGLFLNPKK